ncbi:Glycine dehydrogenase (decarboxylating) [Frankliniella fusca]|uniref:Glycine dehydrogenase (Decarboxylating) n=1 Tax=Frankliniella fusca TaxID=407009 RepID=A0AAE1HDC3_9NEOP|nr:Glycine dehydrogenase (decarboxylating) [Frankliniella fusca]
MQLVHPFSLQAIPYSAQPFQVLNKGLKAWRHRRGKSHRALALTLAIIVIPIEATAPHTSSRSTASVSDGQVACKQGNEQQDSEEYLRDSRLNVDIIQTIF